MELTQQEIYRILIAHLARGKRKTEFFGDLALSEKAFANSLIGNAFPTLYYEIYLQGEPRTDMHVSVDSESVHACGNIPPHLGGGGYEKFFAWYKTTPGKRTLHFAYDLSEKRTDSHGIQLFFELPFSDVKEYFRVMGSEASAEYLREHTARTPNGWRPSYFALLQGRPGSPVRIDYFVRKERQELYAKDIGVFAEDLKSVGFDAVNDEFLRFCGELARAPFPMELQFNVLGGGKADSTIGVSSALAPAALGLRQPDRPTFLQTRESFSEGGAACHLLQQAETRGLSDSRWRYAKDIIFHKRLSFGGASVFLYSVPVFLKVRWREGKPLDAKIYDLAGAGNITSSTA